MGGSTMIMAPAVETTSSFPRSHSSPDLELLSLSSLDKSSQTQSPHHQSVSGLQSIPSFDLPTFNVEFNLDTTVFLGGEQAGKTAPVSAPSIVETKEVPEEPSPTRHARKRTSSLIDTRGWLSSSKSTTDLHEEPPRPTTSAGDKKFGDGSNGDLKPLQRTMTKSGSFANFAKRSWRPSRSPSPMKNADSTKDNEKVSGRNRSESTTSVKLTKTRKRPGLTVEQADKNKSTDSLKSAGPKAFSRASGYFSKLKSKQAGLSKLNTSTDSDNSCASSATSLAAPASIIAAEERTPQSSTCDTTSATTVTDESSSVEMPPQQRDVLWSSFKAIDMDFKGFLAKSTAQRMSQVQTQLLPFLRNTMNHESTKLYPEDVDRRATILNKWWIAILEMLDGQAPQPVPGVDRPVLFDAATLLMTRHEWRQATSYFLPLINRSPAERVRARSLTTSSASSVTSSQAAFLEESAEHNVRTMFVSNLVKQMAFVVEKLSLRNVPVSLVNFAGKACAYAFFFAPGVADILIRLWGLSPELIRRVADELGLPKKNKGESDDIAALFPPTIGVFAWTSPKGMWDGLKKVPRLPMLVSRIPWTGPWAARWKGRDTDVFFIFCKYFHILSEQFMPPGLPLLEKARSPAFALVQAQLLYVLDTTVHRQSPMDGGFTPPAMDSMSGADAAMALPLPVSNVMRGMSENRCIMLLKDFLSDETTEIAGARHTFAETFATMMKAATRKVSKYNHPACFTLCDFLEEVLVLYSEFEDPDCSNSYLDWAFWFDVCQKVMSSLNTMSEIRMLALVYSIWDAISKDPVRKLAVCKDWLLTEETFNEFFNHWCPMVRAYYQRLLCWRMCRDTGTLDEVDGQIFALVAERLQTTWSHYLHIKHTAEQGQRIPPSTAPVNPAPGKRFMIIRQEINVPQPGLYMGSFDSFAKLPNSETSVLNGLPPDPSRNDGRKRWSLLGKVLSLGGNTGAGAGWDDDFQTVRRETAESRSSGTTQTNRNPNVNHNKGRPSEDDSLYSQPTYEEPKYVFKFILAWQQQAAPLRDRFLTRPRLPGPAQTRISGPLRVNGFTVPAGYAAPTRKFSGSPQQGLIDNARNANSLSPTDEQNGSPSWKLEVTLPSLSDESPQTPSFKASPSPSPSPSSSPTPSPNSNMGSFTDAVVDPVKPTGLYVKNSVYTGRSLAEWAQVVFECNNFVERRRDEGMENLGDVEIPILGVEGFRKVGG